MLQDFTSLSFNFHVLKSDFLYILGRPTIYMSLGFKCIKTLFPSEHAVLDAGLHNKVKLLGFADSVILGLLLSAFHVDLMVIWRFSVLTTSGTA